MSRLTIFLLVTIIFTGCSFAPIKEEWKNQIVGKTGVLKLPVIVYEISENKEHKKGTEFKRCDPVKILDVYQKDEALYYYIEVSQNENKFLLSGLSGLMFDYTTTASGEYKERPKNAIMLAANSHLAPSFPFKDDHVKIGAKSYTKKELLCQKNSVWTSMTEEEFYFVRGFPQKKNTTVRRGNESLQLIYQKQGGNEFEKDYFYIENGKLTSWQN
ncbi:MAG: hypothetical protein ABL927_13655 [Bdellovibrionales bacterium]